MASRVPAYMVPSSYRWQESLPLTGNGKIDRKALSRIAQEVVPETAARIEELSATEQRLAEAWASVLGIPQDRIGRQDSFFALGGTSLSAVKLAVRLKRAVSIKDVMQTPVLADLAELLDAVSVAAAADPPGPMPAGTAADPATYPRTAVGQPLDHPNPQPLNREDLS